LVHQACNPGRNLYPEKLIKNRQTGLINVYYLPNFTTMKKIIYLIIIFMVSKLSFAQDKENISAACLNYIEGFYEGDTTKLISSLKPTLHKFGFWKDNKTGKYNPDGYMTFRQALDYAKAVYEKKNFVKPGAPKIVQLLDLGNAIASAKVTAWWGIDYILLSKQDDKWMIEQVLWEGPLEKQKSGK
jgi:hypothetical protein